MEARTELRPRTSPRECTATGLPTKSIFVIMEMLVWLSLLWRDAAAEKNGKRIHGEGEVGDLVKEMGWYALKKYA